MFSSFQNENKEKFKFVVDSTYSLSSGALIIVGKVLSGEINLGDEIGILKNGEYIKAKIHLFEIFGETKNFKIIKKGNDAGIHVFGIEKSEIRRLDTLIKYSEK